MAKEVFSYPFSTDLYVGNTIVAIPDVSNLMQTIESSDESTELASNWFEEVEHERLLASAVWLERLFEDERTLHGQVFFDSLTNSDQENAALGSLYQHLVTTLGYDTAPSTFESDTSGRCAIVLAAANDAKIYVRAESHDASTDTDTRGAQQFNLSMLLSENVSENERQAQVMDFLRLWGASHDFINEMSAQTERHSKHVHLEIPSSRLDDSDLYTWQILSDIEADYPPEVLGALPLDISNLDIPSVAQAMHGTDISHVRAVLRRLINEKFEKFGETGILTPVEQHEIISSLSQPPRR